MVATGHLPVIYVDPFALTSSAPLEGALNMVSGHYKGFYGISTVV